MILALAFGRADIGYFLGEINADYFQRWMDFYLRSPWGPTRDDMRNSVLVTLLMSAFSESSGELPNPTFPYWRKRSSAELSTAVAMDNALEPDGNGGYRWKGGSKPQELIDEEQRLAEEEEESSKVSLW